MLGAGDAVGECLCGCWGLGTLWVNVSVGECLWMLGAGDAVGEGLCGCWGLGTLWVSVYVDAVGWGRCG